MIENNKKNECMCQNGVYDATVYKISKAISIRFPYQQCDSTLCFCGQI